MHDAASCVVWGSIPTDGRFLAQGWFSGEGLPHVAHGPWVATGSERLALWSGKKATVYPMSS